jgi:alkaline phosphatase D
LIDLAAGTNGVILLSGNIHVGELSQLDTDRHPLFDFTSSGLTHIEKAYGLAKNPYGVGDPVLSLNFGLVDIDWESDPHAVKLSLMDVRGNEVFTYEIQNQEQSKP